MRKKSNILEKQLLKNIKYMAELCKYCGSNKCEGAQVHKKSFAKTEALESKKVEGKGKEGKVANGSKSKASKDNDNDPISRFHTA